MGILKPACTDCSLIRTAWSQFTSLFDERFSCDSPVSNWVLGRLPRRQGQHSEEKRKAEDDGKVEWQIEVQRSVGLDRGGAR